MKTQKRRKAQSSRDKVRIEKMRTSKAKRKRTKKARRRIHHLNSAIEQVLLEAPVKQAPRVYKKYRGRTQRAFIAMRKRTRVALKTG